jgi:hypothetical protein
VIRFIFIAVFLSVNCPVQRFEGKTASILKQSFSGYKKKLKEKHITYNALGNANHSKKSHSVKKKKRIRGIEPYYYFPPELFYFPPALVEPKLYSFTQTFYFLRLFFINEKRGPPHTT